MGKARETDKPTYTTDPHVLERFDQRNDSFSRGRREAQHACSEARAPTPGGDDWVHGAASRAAGAVDGHLRSRFLGLQNAAEAQSETCVPDDAGLDDPAANATLVQDAARKFGADLVGICRLNRTWLYSHDRQGGSVELPESHEWAIVMAIAMDPDGIAGSPGPSAAAATRIGYMRMSIVASCTAQFVGALGFGAVAAGNDTALSVPLAVDAGLGEMGRNGLLITPEFGPCVRICKVLTDLPLEPDSPITLGVSDVCRACAQCVEACPADAIDDAPEPSYATVCPANNPGVLRWPVDADKCRAFWDVNGGSCAMCIPACPFFKRT